MSLFIIPSAADMRKHAEDLDRLDRHTLAEIVALIYQQSEKGFCCLEMRRLPLTAPVATALMSKGYKITGYKDPLKMRDSGIYITW